MTNETFNYREAKLRAKQLWEEGNVILLPHARKRMTERDLSMLDVQHIIR